MEDDKKTIMGGVYVEATATFKQYSSVGVMRARYIDWSAPNPTEVHRKDDVIEKSHQYSEYS